MPDHLNRQDMMEAISDGVSRGIRECFEHGTTLFAHQALREAIVAGVAEGIAKNKDFFEMIRQGTAGITTPPTS